MNGSAHTMLKRKPEKRKANQAKTKVIRIKESIYLDIKTISVDNKIPMSDVVAELVKGSR